MGMVQKLKNLLPTKRRLMQLYFGLLFNANLKGYISGQIYTGADTKRVCVPGMNCYSCPGAVGACPLGSLQGAFSANKSAMFYVWGILLLYAVAFGRLICGWLCPFGLVQDLLYKVKTPKAKKNPVTRALSGLKYVLLVFFVVVIPVLYALRDVPLPAFCKYICPAGTLEGGMLLLSNQANEPLLGILGYLFTWKFLLMVSILVGCIFVFRVFCRFVCPLGALYGLFNKISFFGVKVEQDKCTQCGLCVSHCKVDIKTVGDRECISCGECMSVCPTKAIVWKGPKFLAQAGPNAGDSQKKARLLVRCAVVVVMLGILVGACVYYWNNTPDLPKETVPVDTTQPAGDTPAEGNQVGDLCFGYDLPVVTGDGVSQETVNPVGTGKLTVLNFWGTWCTPCVGELPYFDRIAGEYEEIQVIAVHSYLDGETAPAYVGQYYPQSEITFALDYDMGDGFTSGYFNTITGGNATMGFPITLILDEDGVILEFVPDSLEYEELKDLVEKHLK